MNRNRPRSLLFVLWATLALALWAAGCTPRGPQSPVRETARSAILTLARAATVADQLCDMTARDRRDAKIAKLCADAYDAAREALLGAEGAVDAWDAGQSGQTTCAAAKAAAALGQIAHAIEQAGVTLPLLIVDALSLAKAFGGACRVGTT
ncbi:hypothetical protein LZC95_50280 [Pendulispora brunnea]|uniref:Lipoprotein n=1 Tax=Pendulispora brunnea TaxID=2905690 RepID=A0ABZ2K935_9BACT